MHICSSKLTNVGSDSGLSPGRRQAMIWTNIGILLIRNKLQWNPFKKMQLKMSSGNWRSFCLGLHVLNASRVTLSMILQRWAPSTHDDVIKLNYFPRYWPFVQGITGHQWIPHTKVSDAELWSFPAPEQTVEQTMETLVTWDAIVLIMTSL